MRFCVLLVLAAAATTAFAEEGAKTEWPSDPKSPVAPWTLAEAAQLGHFFGSNWSLALQFHDPEYTPLSREDLIARIRETAATTSPADERDDRRSNRKLMKANIGAIGAAIEAVPKLAGESFVSLLGDGSRADNILFARKGPTRCLILPNLAVPTVYNTVRLEAKQRAEKIAVEVAIPALKAIAQLKALDESHITCVGVGVSFGAKSFIEGGPPLSDMTQSEFLSVSGSVKDIRAMAAGEIAEEELLGRLDIFSQDRSMGPEVKKILLGVRP